MAEGVVGRGRFGDGRLQSLASALLFVVLFLALLFAGALLLPGVGEAPLPAGGGLPPSFIAQFALALAAALAAAWLLRVLLERRPADGLGFPLTRRAPRAAAAGLGAGLLGMTAVVALLSVGGVYGWTGDEGTAGGWLAVVVASLLAFAIPAAAEEAVFRGYLLDSLSGAGGPVVAVLVTSVLFALVHGGNPQIAPLAFVNIFLAGVLLALAVLRTGTLWLATGVHLGWNWAIAGPLDLPVSGIDPYDAPLYDAVPAPPAWLSGGAFGPEGGVAGTAAACAVLALILWLTRPGSALEPADPDRST